MNLHVSFERVHCEALNNFYNILFLKTQNKTIRCFLSCLSILDSGTWDNEHRSVQIYSVPEWQRTENIYRYCNAVIRCLGRPKYEVSYNPEFTELAGFAIDRLFSSSAIAGPNSKTTLPGFIRLKRWKSSSGTHRRHLHLLIGHLQICRERQAIM